MRLVQRLVHNDQRKKVIISTEIVLFGKARAASGLWDLLLHRIRRWLMNSAVFVMELETDKISMRRPEHAGGKDD